MISIPHAIILGIVQGITEWLPVSSSGHLVLTQQLFGLGAPILFDLLVHIATLVVIFVVFWKDILAIAKAWLRFDTKNKNFKLGLFIILANIPTVIIGFFFRNYIEKAFSSAFVVGLALLFTGTLLFFSDKQASSRKMGYKSAVTTGILQGVATIPGVSRSGSTISIAMIQGISKEEAARFSFLIAIPAFIGAALLKAGEVTMELLSAQYITGFVTALVVGYFSLKLLLKIVKEKKLHYFAYYCWALGIAALIFF